ncbi:endonuclease/exonuclease/phosphatase family protein [Plantactinospora siamensis]|uniref:Endonuclease/exonuclease/phosphatase family protein n=1 Tax=Plantactinospora siamensis TaxID=555372 RepID=A0ABV6P693_9ACTN
MRLRVLTWNVYHDAGDPRRTDLLNRTVRALEPDLVCLQEVCDPRRGGQLVALLAGTGLRHTTHQTGVLGDPPPGTERYGGTAVATRWPHRVVEVREEHPAGAHWWTLAVAVDVPAGRLLLVAPTTPWQPEAAAARERQAEQITEIDQRHRGRLPTIVAGDLNARPGEAGIRRLCGSPALAGSGAGFQDAWAVAGRGPGHTWSARNPTAAAEMRQTIGRPVRWRIDYVLVGRLPAPRPDGGPRIVAARLVGDRAVEGVWLSDHFGLLADLDLTADPGG